LLLIGGAPRAAPQSRRAARRFTTLFRRRSGAGPRTSRRSMRRGAPRHGIPQGQFKGVEGLELVEEGGGPVRRERAFLMENENAALQAPARFIAQIHPHFREVLQLLAVQIADEARHVEVFTRRATLRGAELGLSTVGGRQSLKTLLDEPDFALASFLLSVM